MGIIYGDIGTSPLYVFKAIIGDRIITTDLIFGGLSCIFWTLTLQTTIKYVLITLRADNKGEGGIFSLLSLVKRRAKWLVIPAMIGGASLLADGMITPPITVSAAIEGLRIFNADLHTIPIVIAIISGLFIVQQFGTSFIGKAFGPIMCVWFTMLAVLGSFYVVNFPEIFKAINPYYAYNIIVSTIDISNNDFGALYIIAAVFLCTTGAEALYSDLGHCGRSNIRVSWIYVKTCLLLNYFGQGVWLLQHEGATLQGKNPFYQLMPEWFLIFGIAIATAAAIIASQAMISEAVRLNLWPKVKINYPSNQKGQIYVSSINWLLWLGCLVVIGVFRESANMEGAYGLAITLTFLMTTILMCVYLQRKHFPTYLIVLFASVYGLLELLFLVSNLSKFLHGGWLTLLLSVLFFSVMFGWSSARKIKNRYVKFVEIEDYFPILKELSEDSTVPKYASQLVYLTSANFSSEIESKIIYSILQKQPKRADVYWLVHVDVTDEPHTLEYKVNFLVPGKLIRIDFRLGFRIEQRINILFRMVVEELVKKGEVDITSRYESLNKHQIIGDFRFVVLEKIMSKSNKLSFKERLIMDYYFLLKHLSLSEERGFGLDLSFVTVEKVPLVVSYHDNIQLQRIT